MLPIIILLIGVGGVTFGIFQLRQTDTKNFFLDSLKKNILPKTEAIEPLKKGSAEDRFLVADFHLHNGDMEALEEALTKIIIEPKTPKFWRVRSLYNLANLQILGFSAAQDPSMLKNAVFYYQEALRLEPDFWPAKYNLERLLQEDSSGKKKGQRGEGQEGDEEQDKKQADDRQRRRGTNPPPRGLP